MYANWAILDIKKSLFKVKMQHESGNPGDPKHGESIKFAADMALMGFCLAKLAVHSLTTP